MSCIDCEEYQQGDLAAFYRWKSANVEIRACKKHMLEMFNALSDFQSREKEE